MLHDIADGVQELTVYTRV